MPGPAVCPPETANAATPYQVSPVVVVVTETVSEERGEADTAYHVCTNWPPPMESWDSLGRNVRPAESLTEKVAPYGQQSQLTIITSFDWVVVSEKLHEVTYPQPVEAEPSNFMPVVETAGLIASTMAPKSLPCGVPKDSIVEGVPVVDDVAEVADELALVVAVEELELVAVEELVPAVVEEPDDHTGVPPGNEDTEPPMIIASFCNPEF
jgi:hypothetical protein